MKKNYYINGTSSYNWLGPTVGIIRTEEEIIKALRKELGANLEICIWENNHFKIIKYEKYLKKRRKYQLKIIMKVILSSKYISKIKTLFYKTFSYVFINFFLSHSNLQRYLKNILYYPLKKITKVYNKLFILHVLFVNHKALKSLLFSSYNPNVKVEDKNNIFLKGDIFLSCGLEWSESYPASFHFLKNNGVKIVTICYDLIPIKFPLYCFVNFSNEFSEYLINILHGSNYIFCISNNTKEDLENFVNNSGAPSPKIKTLRLGTSLYENYNHSKKTIDSKPQSKFILYVSTIETRKNHRLIVDVYILAKKKNIDLPNIVFIGMKGWGVESLLKEINIDSYLKSKILFLNNIDDNDLGEFYKNSLFCVYPSFYEGWGLPIVEAASFGKVTICSNIRSLREAGGKYMKYINPESTESWLDAMHSLSSNNLLLEKIQNKIIKHFPLQKWEDTAKQLIREIK